MVDQVSNLIVRHNGQRKATVSLNVGDGFNLGHLVDEVKRLVDPIVLSKGLYANYGGQCEAQQQASKPIAVVSVGVVLLIWVLLTVALNSMKCALLVLLNIPLALIGGIIAVYLSSGHLIDNLRTLAGISSDEHYVYRPY